MSCHRGPEIKPETRKNQSLRYLSEAILKSRPEEKKFATELSQDAG